MIKTSEIKKLFPIFRKQPDLVYLDSTATSLKPLSVIEKITEYYSQYSANVFRGIYPLSERATTEFEETRKIVSEFINANNSSEVVFTRNTTESINLIAYSLGRKIVEEKDEIVSTVMEHHSNFVPWQVLAAETGATFKVIDIDYRGYLDLKLKNIITKKTKILALTYISNVLGTINPIKEIVRAAKIINPKIIIVIDAAQAVPHMKIDVQKIGADFIAFSSHKMLGATGVGVLWGKSELLKDMYPFMYGGEMISEVYLDHTTYKEAPHKFEAGTPSIGEVIALKEAVKFLEKVGTSNIREHEKKITSYAFKRLIDTFGQSIKIYGPRNIDDRGGIISFNFDKYHPHDIAQILADQGICVRAGHHCAMPLHTRLNISATVRASFYLYNGEEDVDKLVDGLKKIKKILS